MLSYLLRFSRLNQFPRNINVICEGSLVFGYADDIKPIAAEVVEAFAKERISEGLLTVPDCTGTCNDEDWGLHV